MGLLLVVELGVLWISLFAGWVGGLCIGLCFNILIELSFRGYCGCLRLLVLFSVCLGLYLCLFFGFGFVWILLFLMNVCYFCLFFDLWVLFGFVLIVLSWTW